MVDVFASLSVAPAALRGLTLDGSAYAIAYTDADDFDQSEFRLGGAYAWSPRDWWIETGAHFVYGTIGGSGFERELALSARAVRYLDNESSTSRRIDADSILDSLVPQSIDWRDTVRRYPIGSVLAVGLVGYLVGRTKGSTIMSGLTAGLSAAMMRQLADVFEGDFFDY